MNKEKIKARNSERRRERKSEQQKQLEDTKNDIQEAKEMLTVLLEKLKL